MIKTKRTIVLLMIEVLILFQCSIDASAQENTIGFYISPKLPSNQISDGSSYFSLLMQPNQKQTLEVLVVNENDEDIQVAIEVNTAFTNQNGVIEYTAEGQQDTSPDVNLSELITIEEPLLHVPAKGTAMAKITVEMPAEPFEGDLLGGILFTRVPEETEGDGQADGMSGGIQIKNVFRYCVAIHLIQTTEKAIEPDFEISGAHMGTVAGFPALVIDISNVKPLIALGVTLNVQVYPQSGGESILSFESVLSMAPNTSTAFSKVLLDITLPEAGTYRLEATLCYESETWHYEGPLSIE